jgi:O-antigen/teichoic acid export membrane protein
MKTSRQVTWNAVTKWVATLSNAGIELLIIPFLIVHLGKEGYGLAGIAAGIISLTTIADLGLRGSLTRQLTEAHSQNNIEKFNQFLSSALMIYSAAGLFLAGCFMAMAPILARAFKVPEEFMPQGIFLIRVYASSAFCITLVRTCFCGVLASQHRYDLINHVNAGTGIVKGGLLFVVLGLTNTGLYGWASSVLFSLLLAILITYILARKVYPQFSIGLRYVRTSAVGELLSLGLYFFFINLIGILGEQSQPIIVTVFLGPAAVALYRPAKGLSGMGRMFVLAMAWQLHPLTTKYYVAGEMENLRSVLIRGTRYSLLMGIPIFIFLSIFAEPITFVWLGKQLGDSYRLTAWMLAIFALTELFAYAGGCQGATMIGMKRLRFPLLLNLPLAIGSLAASVFLVGYTSLGVLGVAIPTLAVFMIRLIFETIYVAHITGVGLGRYVKESYLRPLLLLILLIPMAVGLRIFLEPRTVLSLILCAGLVSVFWMIFCWLIGFNRFDRKEFIKLFSGALKKFFPGNASKICPGNYAEEFVPNPPLPENQAAIKDSEERS